MKKFLKHYNMKIEALSPIHIGSGQKIGKKEYIYLPLSREVLVTDIEKLYGELQKKRLERKFETDIMSPRYFELGKWLERQGIQSKDYIRFEKYRMDAGGALLGRYDDKKGKVKEIDAFIKDAYGLPYVPGSSIKGMIRTALLAYECDKNPEKFRAAYNEIRKNAEKRIKNRTNYLGKETTRLETEAFHTLQRENKKIENAVNSNLSGLIISDSQPIALSKLTLSQKIDYTLDGNERSFPILRESLMPETEILFEITIDTSVCPYTIQDIMTALNLFNQQGYQYFYQRFQRGNPSENIIWLGGGIGFTSKTVLHSFFGKEAYRVIDEIYKNNLGDNYSRHKHQRDLGYHLAPHVCKCTYYHGKLYDMGMGRMKIVSES